MYDVRIINNEPILFEDDNELNLERYRDKYNNIRYVFDDGSLVRIWYDNAIAWFDSNGECHRDGDMPSYTSNIYMSYQIHGKWHRENGPAVIYPDGSVEYRLDGIKYTKDAYINELISKYGCISCMM